MPAPTGDVWPYLRSIVTFPEAEAATRVLLSVVAAPRVREVADQAREGRTLVDAEAEATRMQRADRRLRAGRARLLMSSMLRWMIISTLLETLDRMRLLLGLMTAAPANRRSQQSTRERIQWAERLEPWKTTLT